MFIIQMLLCMLLGAFSSYYAITIHSLLSWKVQLHVIMNRLNELAFKQIIFHFLSAILSLSVGIVPFVAKNSAVKTRSWITTITIAS